MRINKTTYQRTVPSDSLLGGWKIITVTRKAHNRKRSYATRRMGVFRSTTRSISFGVLVGSVLGCAYLQSFGDITLRMIYPTAQAQEVVTPVSSEQLEGVALAAEAGQLVATPSASVSEKQEVMNYIIEVFGDDADRAIWIAKCESGLRKEAINDKNRNGSVDYGVFQINSVHIKRHGEGFTVDWKENVRVAKQIFDEQDFRPWVCATAAGEKNYLNK